MGGRTAVIAVLGGLALAPAAQAQTFSLSHLHSGVLTATAQGSVAFGTDGGGASVNLTVTDRSQDGWCAQAWVTSNLPPSTHKTYRVCGVAKQQTWSLELPGGDRCNVAFVEVQAGRIDPSNNDKIELGQAARLTNPCPPPPPPPPVPEPTPPPKIDALVTHLWDIHRRWSRNTKLLVRDIPAGAKVKVRCRGRGCPKKKTRTLKVKKGTANVRPFLRKRHLRVGTKVEISITAPGMIGKFVRLKIRRKAIPRMTRYCLPPGVSKPQRCT